MVSTLSQDLSPGELLFPESSLELKYIILVFDSFKVLKTIALLLLELKYVPSFTEMITLTPNLIACFSLITSYVFLILSCMFFLHVNEAMHFLHGFFFNIIFLR